MDTVFSLPGADTSRVSASGQHQTGVSTLRFQAIDLDSLAGGSWKGVDTTSFRGDEHGIWAGNGLASGAWTRDSLDLLWRWWAHTSGLISPDPSVADHAWLQEALSRWRFSLPWGLRAGALAGALMERQDTGTATLGLDPGQPPGEGDAAALWGGEASWAGGKTIPTTLDGLVLEDQGDGQLRLSRRSAGATFLTSLAGDGSDSLRAFAGWDSLRLRSQTFLTDRSEGSRQVGASWTLPVRREVWTFDGSWVSSDRRDLTGRDQGQDLTGAYGDIDFAGLLGWGWSQHQRLSRSLEDRSWTTQPTGIQATDSAQAAQDQRDGDRTGLLQLSDTLRWTTERAGGWTALAGLIQSLRQVRHPDNPDPVSTDRPDEDLSRRTLTVSVFGRDWGWGEHPLATWNTLLQEDVFPRATQSIQTTRRLENRFSIDLDPSLLDAARLAGRDSSSHWLRPLGGLWGREQRNRWRFDTSRTEGLLEEGWSAGLEAGPASRPWATLRWVRWRVWTGTLPGQDFAPDQIQDSWAPELSSTIPLVDSIVLRPWAKSQVEHIRIWNDSGWVPEVRSLNSSVGMDLSWAWSTGRVRANAGWEWNEPGWGGWTGGFSAQMFL